MILGLLEDKDPLYPALPDGVGVRSGVRREQAPGLVIREEPCGNKENPPHASKRKGYLTSPLCQSVKVSRVPAPL
jgi:hypothetical protein